MRGKERLTPSLISWPISRATDFGKLPDQVVDECKRVILDSSGCGLGAIEEPKRLIGIKYGRLIGGPEEAATMIGTGDRVLIFGAAFANGGTDQHLGCRRRACSRTRDA
jgi:2-methylcitrate dehydratase PrpD